MSESKLGKLVAFDEGKDAMHVAVIPALLKADLPPGCPVSIRDGWAYPSGEHIGIIDPFLNEAPKKGNRVWVLIYPNQVTNLRHEWSHPLLQDEDPREAEYSDECSHC